MATTVDVAKVKSIRLFSDVDHDTHVKLAAMATLEHHQRGELLFEEGKDAVKLYCLVKGRVALQLDLPNQRRITIYTSRDGGSIGWSVFVEPHEYTVSGRCVEETEFLTFKREDIHRLFHENPEVGFLVMRQVAKTIARRFKDVSLQLVSLAYT